MCCITCENLIQKKTINEKKKILKTAFKRIEKELSVTVTYIGWTCFHDMKYIRNSSNQYQITSFIAIIISTNLGRLITYIL